MIMEVIGILLGVVWIGMCSWGKLGFRSIAWFIDPASMLCMLVLTLPVLLRNGMGKDFLRAFKLLNKKYTCRLSELRRTLDVVEMMQKQIIYAGIVFMLISIIYVLVALDDFSVLGPNIAITTLTLFYAVIMELLLLPVQVEVKRRIIDYMEEE